MVLYMQYFMVAMPAALMGSWKGLTGRIDTQVKPKCRLSKLQCSKGVIVRQRKSKETNDRRNLQLGSDTRTKKMAFDDEKRILLDLQPDTDINIVLPALEALSEYIMTTALPADTYGTIARALVDKVAPLLASWPREDSEKGCRLFDAVLLSGNASVAFGEMSSAVAARGQSSEVIARTLVMFVNRRLGGVERLRAVLSAADARDHITALVHLPTRIFNVLYAESANRFEAPDILQEDQYFGTLAEAIYLQPKTPDPQRDYALSELLNRMVRMKQADSMVSCWLSRQNTERIINVILRTPQSSVESLIRALLNMQTDSVATNRRVRAVLVAVLHESRIACEACISKIPFERPLLKRPRTALKRLTTAVDRSHGKSLLTRALFIAAERWSAEDFSLFADIQLQRQVTRLLLYYLRRTTDVAESKLMSGEDSVMLALVEGVHLRLGQNDVRIRRHGMVIGEASSRHCEEKDPLTFDRDRMTDARKDDARNAGDERFDDGGDSDFTELAFCVGKELSDEEITGFEQNVDTQSDASEDSRQESNVVDVERTGHSGNEMDDYSTEKRKAGSSRRSKGVQVEGEEWWTNADGEEHAWAQADDWSSIESYEMTSSSEDEWDSSSGKLKAQQRDYEAVREKISAPMSVARLLRLLREVNKSSSGGLGVDAETTAAGLRTVGGRAERSFTQRGTTVHAGAVELLLEVVSVDAERFPEEFMGEIREARRNAMQRLVELDVAECGVALVERVICGRQSDVGKRSECLAMLSAGVRGAQARGREVGRRRAEEQAKKAEDQATREGMRRIGTVTRRVRKSDGAVRLSGIEVRAWDDEGLGRVFDALASGLCGGGGGDFIELDGRDTQLWAQGIVTLAVVASVAGVTETGGRMRADVVDIAMGQVLGSEAEADAVVRRGCALALGAVVEAMTDREIQGRVVVGMGAGAGVRVGQGNGGAVHEATVGLGDLFGDIEGGEIAGVRRAADWLRHAAKGDSDVGVRRFAARALRIWAHRVEGSG